MKHIGLLFISLFSLNLIAQDSVNINEDIDALKIAAGLQVELYTNADENKIVASEKVFEAINYKVRENKLTISSSIETLIDGDVPLNLKVYVKKLNDLNVVQGSGVEFKKLFKTEQMTLRAGEGSIISGELDVKSVDVKVLTGGLIDLKGKAESQNVEVKTGGEYEAKALKTLNTNVQISYGGNARVYVTKNCEAKIIVGGTIDIFGNPEFLNEKTNFGGTINLR
jgi:hypothetical protein